MRVCYHRGLGILTVLSTITTVRAYTHTHDCFDDTLPRPSTTDVVVALSLRPAALASCFDSLVCLFAQTEGVKRIHDIGSLSVFEKDALDKMVPELEAAIQKGIKFVRGA
jgi:hypothetical protein